jgi:hypothetical protein
LEEIKNVYRILFWKVDKRNFRRHGHKWDSNVKVDFKENVGCILNQQPNIQNPFPLNG